MIKIKETIILLGTVLCLCTANKTMAYDFHNAKKEITIYYNITSTTNLTGEVTYTNTNYNSYSESNYILSTVINHSKTSTVTTIGNAVFYGCSRLISVTILNSVTDMGNAAFAGSYINKYQQSNIILTKTI
jgi:hypothetical protein